MSASVLLREKIEALIDEGKEFNIVCVDSRGNRFALIYSVSLGTFGMTGTSYVTFTYDYILEYMTILSINSDSICVYDPKCFLEEVLKVYPNKVELSVYPTHSIDVAEIVILETKTCYIKPLPTMDTYLSFTDILEGLGNDKINRVVFKRIEPKFKKEVFLYAIPTTDEKDIKRLEGLNKAFGFLAWDYVSFFNVEKGCSKKIKVTLEETQ